MSPQLAGYVAPPAIAVAVGLVFAFLGFRSRNRSARYAKFLRIGAPLLLLATLAWLLVAQRPDGWGRHATADGACGIDFPQAPRHEVNPDGEEGDRLEVVIPERHTRYSLTFSDLSPTDAARPVDDVFRDLREIYATTRTPGRAAARLLKELAITDRGFPGREYQFAVGDRIVTRIKVFVNGARVYRAIAVNPPDAALDRDAQRFIDSFRFEATKP